MVPKVKAAGTMAITRSNSVHISSGILKVAAVALTLMWAPSALAQETATDEAAPVTVLSFKWQKDRRAQDLVDTGSRPDSPQPAMIPQNKNFARQVRANEPPGNRDPNQDTLDGRSAELDRITAQARADEKPKTDGFTYRAKIQNKSTKVVAKVFWEYQFKEKDNPAILSRRQFVCLAKVKPENTKDLEIFTLNAPSAVVSVKTMGKKAEQAFDETVIINRVEFDDLSTWQRKDWAYDEVKLTALPSSDSKKLQNCRGL